MFKIVVVVVGIAVLFSIFYYYLIPFASFTFVLYKGTKKHYWKDIRIKDGKITVKYDTDNGEVLMEKAYETDKLRFLLPNMKYTLKAIIKEIQGS